MITRRDLEIAEQCTSGADCEAHLTIRGLHHPLVGVDVMTELREWIDVNAALEQAMSDAWDADSTMSEIAGRWIKHMATTHGAHCAGPHCTATADAPAYVEVIRAHVAAARKDNPTTAWRLEDLAHELGVDLDATSDAAGTEPR